MWPFFAFLCPPIAVLMCGKWFQGLFISPRLTVCFWIPGIIHAGVVVHRWQKAQSEHELLRGAEKATIVAVLLGWGD